jgi:tetratricopeptide (TPR) repeat protein
MLLCAATIAAAAIAAYSNSFAGPFVFDDPFAIASNPTIRHLWPPWAPLLPPHGRGLTVEGRPLLNLSLALDYAVSGTRVWSYHATNLLIHILAGLTLLGIVRRTLSRWKDTFPDPWFAGLIALIWTLHPLQTESVTYIIQRAESLMGLFYLLTLYLFIRSTQGVRPPEVKNRGFFTSGGLTPSGCFQIFSVAACICCMGTKEVAATLPIAVLLYDRTFIAGSFAAAWRRRRRLYLALASTWLILGLLVLGSGNRGGTVGFGIGVSPWAYALTQCDAITRYLRLAVWPHPLVFDYGAAWVKHPADVLPQALIVAALVLGGILCQGVRPPEVKNRGFFTSGGLTPSGSSALGYAIAWFLLILAPTSLIPGDRQTMAEHRMYLPLASVVAAILCGAWILAGKWRRARPIAFGCIAAGIALGCLGGTHRRNRDYSSAVALYGDTVAKRPDNALARYNLGMALAAAGRPGEAAAQFEATLRLVPEFPQAEFNLGNALAASGRPADAIAHFETAVRINPNYAEAHYALGCALLQAGRRAEARWHFNAAWLIRPDDGDARRKRDGIDAGK